MTGGNGNDFFFYESVSDSPANSDRDKITDFTPGQDKIWLSPIDANLNIPVNQSFTETQGSYSSSILTLDIIGGADMQIELSGAPAISVSDFIL